MDKWRSGVWGAAFLPNGPRVHDDAGSGVERHRMCDDGVVGCDDEVRGFFVTLDDGRE